MRVRSAAAAAACALVVGGVVAHALPGVCFVLVHIGGSTQMSHAELAHSAERACTADSFAGCRSAALLVRCRTPHVCVGDAYAHMCPKRRLTQRRRFGVHTSRRRSSLTVYPVIHHAERGRGVLVWARAHACDDDDILGHFNFNRGERGVGQRNRQHHVNCSRSRTQTYTHTH